MYTTILPIEIAKLLESAGMPADIDVDVWNQGTQDEYSEEWTNTTYAEAFDWMMKQGLFIFATPHTKPSEYHIGDKIDIWDCYVNGDDMMRRYPSWYAAADAAILKALELINEETK